MMLWGDGDDDDGNDGDDDNHDDEGEEYSSTLHSNSHIMYFHPKPMSS